MNHKLQSIPEAAALNTSEVLLKEVRAERETLRQGVDKHLRGHCRRITDDHIEIVSFDVFDTLVCRSVMEPVDVFHLIAQAIALSDDITVSQSFVDHFVKCRRGTEQLLRYKLDKMRGAADVEEMQILDVYTEMLHQAGENLENADRLVALEQAMELRCLKVRKAGYVLFQQALAAGKTIIIISDFIHPGSFVEQVLSQCGYAGWSRLYVSSDVGLKKHSGRLFEHVLDDLGDVDKDRMCHFGDNPQGDIKMAQVHGVPAYHLPSGPSLVKQLIKRDALNHNAIANSLVTRAIYSHYANRYLYAGQGTADNHRLELILTREEFGYLTIGPLMYAFSRWLLQEAERESIEQIILFARDSILPFEILKMLQSRWGLKRLNLCYVPVSRRAVAGLNLRSPADVWKVRIDDFKGDALLVDLLECRFLLQRREICDSASKEWTDKPLDAVTVSDLPAPAIYKIAKRCIEANWGEFSSRITRKRALVREVFASCGVDFMAKSIAVDVGYIGTILTQIDGLFEHALMARFFMTYSNGAGHDPIPNVKAFYRSNMVPQRKDAEGFIYHLRFFETLINEGVGSVLDYVVNADGAVDVILETDLDPAHIEKVQQVHAGALLFAKEWIADCGALDEHAHWEPAMMDFVFKSALSHPTTVVARLLGDLVFDNSYAGQGPRSFVHRDANGISISQSMWKEGARALIRAQPKRFKYLFLKRGDDQRTTEIPTVAQVLLGKYFVNGYQPMTVFRRCEYVILRPFLSERFRVKLIEERQRFFADASSKLVRAYYILTSE